MALKLDERPGSQYDDDWKPPTTNTNDLESLYNAPPATDEDLPAGHPSRAGKTASPGQLAADESAGGAPGASPADRQEQDRLTPGSGGLYKDEGAKRGGGLWSVRKKIAIAGTTASVVIGAGFGVFSFLSKPFEFLHLDNALGRHSRLSGAAIEARMFAFTRAARAYKTGYVGETRVGYLGSRSFNKLLDRLASRQGIRIDTRWQTGKQKHMVITVGEGSAFRGLSKEATTAAVEGKLGLRAGSVKSVGQLGDGTPRLRVDIRGMSAKELDRFIGNLVRLDNETANQTNSRLHQAMRKRFLKKAWGAPSLFNPIDRAAYRIDQKIWDVRDRRQAERDRKNRAGKIAKPRSDVLRNNVDKAREKMRPHIGRVGASLAITGGLCVLKEASDLIPYVNHETIILAAQEEALDKQAVAAQMKSGQNFYARQLGFVSETFGDKQGRRVWKGRALNSSANGGPGEGVDASPALRQAFAMRGGNIGDLVRLLNEEAGGNHLVQGAAGAADVAGEWVCSGFGYTAQMLLGAGLIVLGPGGAVVKGAGAAKSVAISTAIASLFADLIGDQAAGRARAICGQDKDGQIVDAAAFGNCMAYGARGVANINAASMGGVEISETEELVLNNRLEEQERNEFRRKNLASRLFDAREHRSLAGSILMKGRSAQFSWTSLAASIPAAPLSLAGKLSSLTQPVKAEPPSYDWGFPLVSVPMHILEDPKYEDPFANARRFAGIYYSAVYHESLWALNLLGRANTCFGVTFSRSDVDDRIIATAETDVIMTSDAYKNARCNDLSNENWVVTMLFVLDDAIVTSMDCYEGGALSCAELGFDTDAPIVPMEATTPAPAGGYRGQDTSAQPCRIGADAGVASTPDPNIRIRLCSVEGIVVNVAIESNIRALLDAGQRDGFNFSGWGFRDTKRQTELRRKHCGPTHYDIYERPSRECRPPTARPGRSMHEWGLAVDFTCNGGSIGRGSPCFNWLENNRAVHGLQHRASGPWHWSTTGF